MKELMFSHRGQTYGTSVGEFRSFKKWMQKLDSRVEKSVLLGNVCEGLMLREQEESRGAITPQ